MSKYQNDLMLDAALDYIRDNAAKVTLCSAQPTTYAEANATFMLASVATVTGDFAAIADGTTGRKQVVPQRTDVTVDATGTATHVAIISGAALLYVTTCVSQAVTAANLVTIPEWDIELRDAV